jgi:hypothetical protein
LAGHTFQNLIGVGYINEELGEGILGIGLFNDVLLKLNYPEDLLSISDDSLPEADGKHIFTYKEDNDHRPVIPVVLDSMPMSAVLDTGGARDSGTDIMVPLKLASQLHLTAPMQPFGEVSDFVGYSEKCYIATLAGDLTIGEVTISHPKLLISDAVSYMNLGGVSNRLIVTLDHRNHRMKLELPSDR